MRMSDGGAVLVIEGLFYSCSYAFCHYVISVINVCFCSENSVSYLWLAAIRQWEDEPGKRAAEEIKPAIFQMHSDFQSQKKSHVRQFTFIPL